MKGRQPLRLEIKYKSEDFSRLPRAAILIYIFLEIGHFKICQTIMNSYLF